MADLDLDAIASRPGDGAIFLSNWERDALVAEVRRLRAALEAASAHAVEASDYADRYKAEVDRLRAVLHRRWPVVVESGRG